MKLASSLAHASARAFGIFVRPPFKSKGRATALLCILVLGIGAVDYLAPLELSLSIVYLVPISLGAGWFGWRAGLMVALACTIMRFGGDTIRVYPDRMPPHMWWNIFAAMLIFTFVVWLVNNLVTAQRALEGRVAARTSELAASIAERHRLELEVLEVTARERAVIGRELHDELGQHLVATALAAKVLAQQLGDQRGGQEAHAIVGWIEQAIAKTRKLARGLLLAHIQPDRFCSELEELAANASQGGVRCRVVQQSEKVTADPGECAQLFRIAQEAIGNALRHSEAHEIEIAVATDPQATCLIVADDGHGFNPNGHLAGMGLRIMEHRAQIIGASLAVLSAEGEGTKVICRLPARAKSAS